LAGKTLPDHALCNGKYFTLQPSQFSKLPLRASHVALPT